jgi:nitrate/nitrite-specific signal transduction histidine kinase
VVYETVEDPIHQTPIFLVLVELLEGPFTQAAVRQTVISIGFALLLGASVILVSVMMARSMARPIQRMAVAAQNVENETQFDPESLSDITGLDDELGMLARVFSQMVVALQKREQKLKKEIQKLKIQIDSEKREEEVDKIVNQDFFKDLQSRAKDLRNGRKSKE